MGTEWLAVAIQAGGAISVCGLFIWFLLKKQTADEEARKTFLDHLEAKDKSTAKAIETQVQYMQQRDVQSKEIAQSGYTALNSLTAEVAQLRATITSKYPPDGSA